MELKNISPHRPSNMIIDVAENEARALIKTGEFIESTKENIIIDKKKVLIDEEVIFEVKSKKK